jgi:uncharacterized protein (TIGR02145 family)
MGLMIKVTPLALALLFGCSQDNPISSNSSHGKINTTGVVADIDGNEYQTVKIGDQWWMAENLKVTRYRTGDEIPNVTDNGNWSKLESGAWVYYNNDFSNDDLYGKLYNWHAVVNSRGLCPEGWRIPGDDDWNTLINYLRNNVGGRMKSIRTEPEPHPRWSSPNAGASDESGFSGLPGGFRQCLGGNFSGIGDTGFWWSSVGYHYYTLDAWSRNLNFLVRGGYGDVGIKNFGFSVRCIKR